MKNRFYKSLLLGALLLPGSQAALRAQSFSVPWFVIAGGGGTTTNSSISLTGTFGQWDASELPLTNGIFSLSSGFWGVSGTTIEVEPPTGSTLFSDDFAGNTINPSNWTVSGSTVFQTNGMIVVSNAVASGGGVLTSVPFALNNSTGLITITRDVLVYPAASVVTNYGDYNFLGQFGINVGAVPLFSVNYADWDYADGVTYKASYGFFLAADGQSPILIADTNVIPAITPTNTPVWGAWFPETVTYNPTNGVMQYFISNVFQTNFNVGILPAANSPTMTLSFNAFGLGTGDYQSMSNLVVTQAPGITNSAAILVLNGNLAFGELAAGSTATNTLTISNAGNSTLTVSNITAPTGFSVSLTNATLTNGGSTNVAVIFSPTTATNNYSGLITVISDATSGGNTIPVSGFVTSGTLELLVDISGNGTVAPKDNGKSFKSGTKISLKATAGTGSTFAGWTGSIVSSANPLVFNITNSMVLQASFVTSPFTTAVTGTYAGLFGATNGVAEATSGLLKGLTVSTKGAYSGTLLISGASHTISGSFTASGESSNYITRTTKLGGPLIVEMTLGLNDSPPQITGTVSNTLTSAVGNLVAYRAVTSGTAEYTMLLAPSDLALPGVPPGYGYLLMARKNGVLTISGNLADGTALTQSVPVVTGTDGNEVPLFDSIYANTGLLTGWLSLASNTAPSGNLDWIKPATPKSLLYPAGITNVLIGQGSFWVAPAPHGAAINLTSGLLTVSGGTLASNINFDVKLSGNNALTKVNADSPLNSLTGTVNAKTGLLTITFGNGDKKETTTGKGAVLQDTTNAAGYFLDKTNAGSILLQP
jgi:hypothetical protein